VTDYFLVMRKIGAVALVLVLGSGCEERERLTFPTPSDGVGPVTTIDQPMGADTTVTAGSDFFVNGTTGDPDGVDSVYFFVINGNQNFSPFAPDPPQASVRWGLPLTTFGHAGETFQVQVYGVDVLGNRGGTSTRQIHIR
jgi:hypothetical protein